MPEAGAAAPAARQRDADRVDACTEDREQRRQEGEPVDDRQAEDDRARDAERCQERPLEEEHAREADRHGDAREHHRAPRRAHRASERVGHREAALQLFAEPRDDEQRVVDRGGKTDERHDVERVRRDVGEAREQKYPSHSADDGQDPDADGNERADDGAEDEHEEDQRDRQRDVLGALKVGAQRAVQVAVDRQPVGLPVVVGVGVRHPDVVGDRQRQPTRVRVVERVVARRRGVVVRPHELHPLVGPQGRDRVEQGLLVRRVGHEQRVVLEDQDDRRTRWRRGVGRRRRGRWPLAVQQRGRAARLHRRHGVGALQISATRGQIPARDEEQTGGREHEPAAPVDEPSPSLEHLHPHTTGSLFALRSAGNIDWQRLGVHRRTPWHRRSAVSRPSSTW